MWTVIIACHCWCIKLSTSQVIRLPKSPGVTADTVEQQQARLMELIKELNLPDEGKRTLLEFLTNHHKAFCLEENKTDLVQFEIDTGDAAPKKLPVRQMPFTIRQEVPRQLRVVEETGVIQPSNSLWASPVVLVMKKDSTHRFCVDYRELNSVTRADTFLSHVSMTCWTSLGSQHTSEPSTLPSGSGDLGASQLTGKRLPLWHHRGYIWNLSSPVSDLVALQSHARCPGLL